MAKPLQRPSPRGEDGNCCRATVARKAGGSDNLIKLLREGVKDAMGSDSSQGHPD